MCDHTRKFYEMLNHLLAFNDHYNLTLPYWLEGYTFDNSVESNSVSWPFFFDFGSRKIWHVAWNILISITSSCCPYHNIYIYTQIFSAFNSFFRYLSFETLHPFTYSSNVSFHSFHSFRETGVAECYIWWTATNTDPPIFSSSWCYFVHRDCFSQQWLPFLSYQKSPKRSQKCFFCSRLRSDPRARWQRQQHIFRIISGSPCVTLLIMRENRQTVIVQFHF